MKSKIKYLLFIFLIFRSITGFTQPDCTTDPPVSPRLTSVSVLYETGKTKLTWTPSPSSGIAAYIIYSFKGGDGMPLDTIKDPSATSSVVNNTAAKYFSVSYVVAAMRLPRCTSSFSNVISSIFCQAAVDTCNKKILITWNTYTALPQKVTGYSILASTDAVNFNEIAVAGPEETNFMINDFTINSDYCFVVRANIEGGSFSNSNKACASTRMQRPPLWINADYATVNNDNKIVLSFTFDPLSEINHFSLERKNIIKGTFREISQPVSPNGSVNFTDSNADIDSVYQYRLSAINSCNIPVTVSNTASNLVLSLERVNNDISLKWNPYRLWRGVIDGYKIFADTGNGFEEKGSVQEPDTSFILKYKEIMFEVSAREICLYVIAKEISNPYGINGESRSQVICTDPTELVTVPNLFTPDNDLINDLFRPVLSFTPVVYRLLISDRHGKSLFETTDFNESWDGTESGKPVPQGVYLWFLKTTTPSGKAISKTGTVTITRGN
jgi:gliding motility-associated-like protein